MGGEREDIFDIAKGRMKLDIFLDIFIATPLSQAFLAWPSDGPGA